MGTRWDQGSMDFHKFNMAAIGFSDLASISDFSTRHVRRLVRSSPSALPASLRSAISVIIPDGKRRQLVQYTSRLPHVLLSKGQDVYVAPDGRVWLPSWGDPPDGIEWKHLTPEKK
jgi:hypothetical protein